MGVKEAVAADQAVWIGGRRGGRIGRIARDATTALNQMGEGNAGNLHEAAARQGQKQTGFHHQVEAHGIAHRRP